MCILYRTCQVIHISLSFAIERTYDGDLQNFAQKCHKIDTLFEAQYPCQPINQLV